jgi:hypothetical protein
MASKGATETSADAYSARRADTGVDGLRDCDGRMQQG